MATPLPHESDVDLAPPSADEVRRVIGGVLGAVREELGIVPKSDEAIGAGSSNPREPAGYTEFQTRGGVAAAISEGRKNDPFGRP